MRAIENIVTLGDLLYEYDHHYYSRPLHSLYTLVNNIYNYVYLGVYILFYT